MPKLPLPSSSVARRDPIGYDGVMERGALLTVVMSCLIQATVSFADIYRSERGGVVHFTDTPTEGSFSLVVRDDNRSARRSRTLPPTSRDLPVEGRISSGPGPRIDPFDGRLSHHEGLDIATTHGADVKPVDEGEVIFSGFRPGYGNVVIIRHPDGTTTLYAHNSRNLVRAGETVTPGTVVALTGSTGRSTGPHLHFEAWRDGRNVTASYIPRTAATGITQTHASAPIRRFLMPDGSIAFTNLP